MIFYRGRAWGEGGLVFHEYSWAVQPFSELSSAILRYFPHWHQTMIEYDPCRIHPTWNYLRYWTLSWKVSWNCEFIPQKNTPFLPFSFSFSFSFSSSLSLSLLVWQLYVIVQVHKSLNTHARTSLYKIYYSMGTHGVLVGPHGNVSFLYIWVRVARSWSPPPPPWYGPPQY